MKIFIGKISKIGTGYMCIIPKNVILTENLKENQLVELTLTPTNNFKEKRKVNK